jgi:uncharacterized membrane protein
MVQSPTVGDFQYKLLPWPNLTAWLGVIGVALVLFSVYEAFRARNKLLLVFWAVVGPFAIFALFYLDRPVPVFLFAGHPVPLRLVAVIGLLVYLSARAYAKRSQPLAWYKTAVLWVLRIGALAPAFVLLTRPVVSWTQTDTRQGLLIWLFDVSGSMYDVNDMTDPAGEPMSRAEAVEQKLALHRSEIADLPAARTAGGEPRLRAFRFALTAQEVDRDTLASMRIYRGFPGTQSERKAVAPGSPNFLGNGSAVGDALDRVIRAFPQELFTGVVLVTDAADNSSNKRPEEAAQILSRLGLRGARLYTVSVGRATPDRPERYVLAGELKAPPSAPLNSAVPVSCEFTFHGFAGKPAFVQLLIDDQPSGPEMRVEIPASTGEHRHTAAAVWMADRDGTHVVALRARVPADPAPRDAADDHPDRVREPHSALKHALIRVERDERRVLLIDRIRPEARFVADALARSGDLAVNRVTLTRAADEAGGVPRDLAEWLRYDVIVLGDIPMAWLSRRRQSDLADAVREHGRGLLAMGGYRAFGAGGYVYNDYAERDAPLAALLPVRCRENEGHLEAPVKFLPTRDGLRDGPLGGAAEPAPAPGGRAAPRLSEPEQAKLWAVLDALDGANRFTYVPPGLAPQGRFNSVKPGATVFAVAGGSADAALLVGGRRGRGRVLALAVDTTWKWVLRPGDEASAKAGREMHDRFWRQMVRWLHVPQPDVRFYIEQDTYFVSQLLTRRPRVHAVLQNLTAEQAERVSMEARLYRVDAPGKPVFFGRYPLQHSGETYAAELAGELRPGRYEVKLVVEGMPGGEEGGRDPPPLTFRIEDRDLEKMNVGARPDRMEEWARLADERPAETGGGRGRSFAVQEFDRLLATLRAETVEETRTVSHVKDLLAPSAGGTPWGAWALFAVTTVLLMLEWILRKAWGMV